MSIVQAILLGVLYWIGEANLPFVGLWTVQRPLVCGWIAGIILGDALTGAMVGASINLVYLGFISAGGSMPADMALAGTLGAAFAITGNLDADTALALAVPIGLLGTLVWYCRMTFDSMKKNNTIKSGLPTYCCRRLWLRLSVSFLALWLHISEPPIFRASSRCLPEHL